MAYITDLFKRLVAFRRPKPQSDMEQRVTWLLQPYAKSLQDIVMWKNTNATICCMLLVNLFLWLIRILTVRPLGLIAGTLLLLVILDGTATALGAGRQPCREPRASKRSEGGEQLMRATVRARQWLSGACADMLQLRRQNPSRFCFIACCGLAVLWLIAHIGGAILVHGMINAVFLAPYLPKLQNTINAIHSHGDSDGEVEEFLPEMSSKAMEELHRAGNIQETNELASLGSIDLSLPVSSDASILYAAAEGESSDEDDFLETKKTDKSSTASPAITLTDSSDSESDFIPKEPLKSISPKESHFLSEAPVKKQVAISSTPSSGTEGWIPFLMNAASYLNYSKQAPTQKSPDSDSDEFELIDKSDL